MISRIKGALSTLHFRRLDKRRADLAMAWAQRHPLTASAYNLANYLFLGAVKTGLLVYRTLRHRDDVERAELSSAAAVKLPVGEFPEQPSVLLVAEASIPQCFQYRVQQKLEMLSRLGWEAEWLPWSDVPAVERALHFHDVIVLYRVPGFPPVMSYIEYARSLNKLLIYDVDDLVFDRQQLAHKFGNDRGQLTKRQYQNLLTGADLYHQALSAVPFCLVSTEPLRQEVEKAGDTAAFVLPNGISTELLAAAKNNRAERNNEEVMLFYGSGTNTHDADFGYVGEVLSDLLATFAQLRVIVVGPVQLDPRLHRFADRVQTIKFLKYESYLELLAYADISIAPLQPGVFADCKSEIKWLEAGLLGVPSVVTKTKAYIDIIDQGRNGFMAENPEQWRSILTELITDPELRAKTGSAAQQFIRQRYCLDALSHRFRQLILECAQQQFEGQVNARHQKIRLLMVNTQFPPQAMGGATRVVKDLIDGLRREFANQYEISVFTCDWTGNKPYALNKYAYDGIVVTTVSIPLRPDVDTQCKDDSIKEIFKRFLAYHQPDLIHFHSIQRLTASMLEAAEALKVPHVVSVHDSWWISDHPFMIDDHGKLIAPNVANPVVASRYSYDVDTTIERNRYLRERLHRTDALIAVSDYQARLYCQNGFTQIKTIENGVDPISGYSKNRSQKLVLGYVGGKAVHKGYFFLKDTLSTVSLANTELVITDVFSEHAQVRAQKWGGMEVKIYPKYEFDKAGEFYSMIDVLIIPSLWPESFGLSLREASLLGIWVVAAATGGMKGAVLEGRNGYAFEPSDGNRLKEILLEIDQSWQKYKQPVPATVVDSLRVNSVAQNARQTHALYQNVLHTPARRSSERK